jgi:hypothetical protein
LRFGNICSNTERDSSAPRPPLELDELEELELLELDEELELDELEELELLELLLEESHEPNKVHSSPEPAGPLLVSGFAF